MRAGKLDRRITIRRLTAGGPNALNEASASWEDLDTVSAQQRPERGSERFAAGQVNGTAVLTFHIRYYPGLSAKDRIVYEDVEYEIVAPPREIGRRVVHEIDCVARKN